MAPSHSTSIILDVSLIAPPSTLGSSVSIRDPSGNNYRSATIESLADGYCWRFQSEPKHTSSHSTAKPDGMRVNPGKWPTGSTAGFQNRITPPCVNPRRANGSLLPEGILRWERAAPPGSAPETDLGWRRRTPRPWANCYEDGAAPHVPQRWRRLPNRSSSTYRTTLPA